MRGINTVEQSINVRKPHRNVDDNGATIAVIPHTHKRYGLIVITIVHNKFQTKIHISL